MAFRRFFSPSRSRSRSGSESPARSPNLPVTVTHLHPPAGDFYLTPQCYMPPPTGMSHGSDENNAVLQGRIEVTLAAGSGPRRIRSIKAGLVSLATLDMGPGRTHEEDVIFETSVDVTTSMLLDEGSHVFDWRVQVPRTLAAHDFHPEGRVTHTIFAEVEIISPSRSRPTTRPSSPRHSMSGNSRSRPPTRPPSPRPSASSSRQNSSDQVMQSPLPTGAQSPMYEDTVDKVVGKRTCMIIHENANEGIANLNLPGDGDTPGLGIYHLRYTSEIWTVCALFNYRLSIPSPSPLSTIYAFAISLDQTTEIISPRDDPATPPRTRTRTFEICSKGRPPAPGKIRQHYGALWTAGEDAASCEIEGTARLPSDDFGRPSTPPMTKTPINVSHHLVMKVWFSVLGEDGYGKPCDPTNTELRMLSLRRPVSIPSCALIPDIVELPSYDSIEETVVPNRTDFPCFLCDKYYSVKDYIAGQMHRSGTPIPQGECKLCGRKIVLGFKDPSGDSGMWRWCACGLSLADMEERMKRVEATTPRAEVDGESGQLQPPKQEYAR